MVLEWALMADPHINIVDVNNCTIIAVIALLLSLKLLLLFSYEILCSNAVIDHVSSPLIKFRLNSGKSVGRLISEVALDLGHLNTGLLTRWL